jgi:hypothetical protein
MFPKLNPLAVQHHMKLISLLLASLVLVGALKVSHKDSLP